MRAHRFGQAKRRRTAFKRGFRVLLSPGLLVGALLVLSAASRALAQSPQPATDPATQNPATQDPTAPNQTEPDQTAQDQAAQDSPSQDQPTTEPAVPATAVPSPPAFSANAPAAKAKTPVALEAPAADGATPAVAGTVPAATPEPAAIPQPTGPQDEKQKAIFDSSATLLKLASSLKAEVDKTTADQLSVSVVRKAGEIEQLAHKMRTQ